MTHTWNTETVDSQEKAFDVIQELVAKRWLCRGQSNVEHRLEPSIDRGKLKEMPRAQKIQLERKSIEILRSTARFFSSAGEQGALSDDIIALMVLRHYGVPTRLLDWSLSPFVATFFAVCGNAESNGAIWTFNEPLYEKEGKGQWQRWPETTRDGSGDPDKFDAKLTAFALDDPSDWFCCGFYKEGFPRQNAQAGAYTMTARFDCDHADAIANLLPSRSDFKLYVIEAGIKESLRKGLQEKYGIWRGALFPDTAGAACTAHGVFYEWEAGVL